MRLVILLGFVAVMASLFGNGCAPMRKGSSDFVGQTSVSNPDEISGIQTLAIANFSNLLKTYDAMIASTTTSNYQCSVRNQISGANGAFTQEVGSLSLDGTVSSYNAPMQMSILKIAAEYCACAADTAVSGSNLFSGFNLGSAASQFTQANIEALGAKMAGVFWGGTANWDSGYSASLYALVDAIRLPANATGQSAANVSRNVALGACTSMMSSFFAIEM
ncbi:MAG: hypothetical protein A4S09_07030 [Proteobacteria bacterium SG_bin7]|nr:MAG: hypothetical protein A4S09_07030 [Proteobacteria bacterium SG_bin7]